MTKGYLYIVIALIFSASSYGQINTYLAVGTGYNSGALVYPYNAPDPWLSVPWNLEVDFGYRLPDTSNISFFMIRKWNAKGGQFLSGLYVHSKCDYYGLRYRTPVVSYKNFLINIGLSVAYGQESVNWEDSGGSWFGGSGSVSGNDRFDLVWTGIYSSLQWDFGRLILLISVEPGKDFVLSGNRVITDPPASGNVEYEKFNYKGTFYLDIKTGLGIRLFKM